VIVSATIAATERRRISTCTYRGLHTVCARRPSEQPTVCSRGQLPYRLNAGRLVRPFDETESVRRLAAGVMIFAGGKTTPVALVRDEEELACVFRFEQLC
jgi:hypothetical protein